jgi:hypothetical protein
LIGTRLLERETEVSSLRRVRDELLATTQAGREWIRVFERVQASLIGMVLEDEELSAEAANLVARAGELVEDEKSTLTKEDVERGRGLLRKLAETSDSDEVRADLEAVGQELDRMAGLTSKNAVEVLMKRGPQRESGPKQT